MKLPYYEKLPCGGILTITSNKWYIEYSFLSVNLNGSKISIIIDSSQIDNHLTALKTNLEIYKTFQPNSNEDVYGIPGLMDMTINLHGPCKGVCLEIYYRPVSSDEDFQLIKKSFTYAKNKANAILHDET